MGWHGGTEEGTGNEHAARELIGPSFKFHSTAGKVACDSHVEEDASVPILNVDYHHVDVPGTLAARSSARWSLGGSKLWKRSLAL